MLRGQGMNEIPISPVCLALSTAEPLSSRRYHCVQPAAHHLRLLECGDFLTYWFLFLSKNVDYTCFFIQEIFIEATIMNKSDKVPILVELYY